MPNHTDWQRLHEINDQRNELEPRLAKAKVMASAGDQGALMQVLKLDTDLRALQREYDRLLKMRD